MSAIRKIFKPDPIEEKRKAFARACAIVFEQIPEGRLIYQHMKADRESMSFDTDALVMAFREGRRDYVRTIDDAIKYFHGGMDDKDEVLTERPRAENAE